MNTRTVDAYIAKLPKHHAETVTAVRKLIRAAAPEAAESIKWSQPVYEVNGPVAYIKAHSAYVNFGFWRGAQLDDPRGLLQGSGTKMRHVSLPNAAAIRKSDLQRFVRQAVELNKKLGNPNLSRGK